MKPSPRSGSIETIFQRAATYVEERREATGSLPDTATMQAWSNNHADGYEVDIVSWYISSHELSIVGKPRPGCHLLELWRSEWFEYYNLCTGKSSLIFDPEKYAFSGNLRLDVVLFSFTALGFACLAWLLWGRRSGSNLATRRRPT
jgi:hypothetical protein